MEFNQPFMAFLLKVALLESIENSLHCTQSCDCTPSSQIHDVAVMFSSAHSNTKEFRGHVSPGSTRTMQRPKCVAVQLKSLTSYRGYYSGTSE